eukprot:TRINITY_DN3962_c0_g1_i1.p1 TRINITY_DN3962_c0_g1~~TRINITY_DN3962_c0_g1_i1.p1  ORF type:complete len:512 (-),score=104.05 TRINITY_DN3962_c0_g1_i1:34-1353(-)
MEADTVTGEAANGGSIFLMVFINFLSNVVFSIVLPSLPSFIAQVGGDEYLNGWAVATNSLGTFIASPLFGWWADKRNFREVFIFSLVLMVLANIWYALSPDMYQLFAARFVVGVAAANYAPAGAYLSYATSSADRAKIMAWNSAATVLGFICGPAFAMITALEALQFPCVHIGSYCLMFNKNTSPGWISALFGILGLFSMIPFREIKRKVSLDKAVEDLKSVSMRSFRSFSAINSTSVPLAGVILSLGMQFSLTTAFTLFETIGPLYTSGAYGWSVWNTSLLFAVISVLSLVALFSLQIALKFINERVMLVLCNISLAVGLAIYIDWNNGWISLTRFYVGLFFISVGYACAAALLLAVFTKILNESEQGIMLGWLSSVGSIARMIIPIVASFCFVPLGPNYLFLGVTAIVFVSTVCSVVFFPTLVPKEEQLLEIDGDIN